MRYWETTEYLNEPHQFNCWVLNQLFVILKLNYVWEFQHHIHWQKIELQHQKKKKRKDAHFDLDLVCKYWRWGRFVDILIKLSKSSDITWRRKIRASEVVNTYIEYRPVLIPKEELQGINKQSEHWWYVPYSGTCALTDLHMWLFTVIIIISRW